MKISNVLISDSWGEIGPDALNRGIGGREGAMIYLSREWARLGHEVTNFVNVPVAKRFEENYIHSDFLIDGKQYPSPIGYHEYIPINATKYILGYQPHDAVIAWECGSLFEDQDIRNSSKVKMVEMQVAHFSEHDKIAAEKYADFVCALSDWHADFLLHTGLDMPREQVLSLPNGVDISRYPKEKFEEKLERRVGINPKFVYSSSPDRGLWYLLQMWPHIRKEFPGAELVICYGVKKWTDNLRWSHGRVGQMAIELEKLIRQPGVKDLDKIGQDVLSKLQMDADIWVYPLDAMSPTETGCITAIENAAAGNPIVTTNCDCMEDEFGKIGTIVKLPFEVDRFVGEVVDILRDHDYMQYQRQTGRKFAESRDWSNIAKKWVEVFEKRAGTNNK